MTREDQVLAALGARIGLDAAQVGETLVRREIRRALADCPAPADLLAPGQPAWDHLLQALLVPETWFFRNPEAFDALTVGARDFAAAAPGRPLRILSLPCATGEEPYSIAMALLEAGWQPEQFQIEAGDISRHFLAVAREGIYGRNAFRTPLTAERFDRFFETLPDGRRQVRAAVRRLVHFAPLNLVTDDLPTVDVLFCRNALIYFSAEQQQGVLERLAAALTAEGLLFLGSVEPPMALRHGFQPAPFPMAFVCRKGGASTAPPRPAAQIPARRPRRPPPAPGPVARAAVAAPRPAPPAAVPDADSLERVRALADCGQLAAAAAMLDRLAVVQEPAAELYCLGGVVYETLGQMELAEQFYRKALFLEPEHTESLVQLSLLLQLDGRTAAARAMQRRARRQMAS